MTCEIGDLPLEALLPEIATAEDQLARLDEVVRRSPVGQGFAERVHFAEAVASMWVAGELVHVEDLVLHDANRDVRTPTHEITIAHSIMRARRRIATAEADWGVSKAGMAGLIGGRATTMEAGKPGKGTKPASLGPEASTDGYDDFAAELANIDVVLERSTRLLNKAGEMARPEALSVGELVIRDPEWDEESRLSEWTAILHQVENLPVTLGAVLLWDAWENLEPLQRQHWLGAQLVNSYLRARGKVSSHLFCMNVGLKTVTRERRRSRDRTVRLLSGLEALAGGAELAMKEIIRLAQVRERLDRKLRAKRSSSSLPGLVELLMVRPLVSSSMIVKDLKISHRAALNLVAELGVREVTGRGSFRAWSIL
ncbi:RHE_PE00001 family protein [Phyllobacterium sp. 22229]|uniref:RHE_PE00001 family protein n=1 Tax=Agrobacterium radiobacter TaxID=362 RepID=A0ABD5LR45_AGRRD